ncbi:MAG: amino acid permease [Candidatus Aminicenantes bacterium]|nr:amino acid permease [Candidatus Aminicenantes bacterium]NIM80242.1 amino acid permease [Candidatus Aminicenantes bacterium]NIN19592.1 amino acid permease [Candidatus Aminicenantes bacterium]NIN43476.1 amino acid permease [Candidatus Aminicenantes bacterium]NIN86221.1 amino acid permease [Candidatus Aminicenantes bacterium]
MAGKEPVSSELSRELNLFHITMMGLGMMIGAGVFLGVGNALHVVGPGGVLLTFLLNGIIAMFTATSYAELSSAIPHAGGAYNYARIGFGRGPSFVAGWMEWYASSVAGSLYAVTFAIYTVRYLKVLGLLSWLPLSTGITEKLMAVLIAVFFIFINYRGASETGKIGALFTLGQTIFLVVIGLIGVVITIKDPYRLQNFQPFLPNGWAKLLITMGFTYVAFEGYEVIAQAGDETIEPRKNLPKAMLYSVFIVTLTYVAVAFATVVAVKAGTPGVEGAPWQWIGSFRERGFGEAISRLLPMGNFLLTLAVIFASTSALNSTIYSATRALYALGRDRMVSPFFAQISKKRKTPWAALMGTAALVILVATVLPTMDVASSASMMFLILFFVVNLCVIRVRWHMGDELTYGFIMPFFPLFPILAIILQAVLIFWLLHMSIIAWIISPLWIITGIIIYNWYSKKRAVVTADEIQVLEEEKAEEAPAGEGEEYRIMVAVAHPKNAIEMVQTTYKLSTAKNARIELIHMVPVPEQVPLTAAKDYMWEGKEAIVETMLYLEPLFPISSTIRYCRNISRGIVNASRQKKANMLIIGWHGRTSTRQFIFSSTIDPIIERSPCNVVALKGGGKLSYKNILLPLAGGPNGAFAFEIASLLLEEQGKITIFYVYNDVSAKRKFDIGAFVKEHSERCNLSSDRIEVKITYEDDTVHAILKETENHDFLVIGATRKPILAQLGRDSIPEIVSRKCTKPLVMAHAATGIQSWIKRLI